jgi:hypothetical protein
MGDGQAKIGIIDADPVSASPEDEQAPVDLRPPVHPRRILLADVAALSEADAVELGCVAFEPEEVAKLGAALAHAQAKAVLEPAARRFGRGR